MKAVKLVWLFPAASENAGGQGDDGLQQLKHGIHRDPDEPEGQEKKPDDGIQKQGEEGERPTENQEKQPKKKFSQCLTSILKSTVINGAISFVNLPLI